MIAVITGGRTYEFTEGDADFLKATVQKYGVTIIRQGGAKGADACAKEWCFYNSMDCYEYKANWPKYGYAAGPVRNKEMLNGADLCIAFPGGAGTHDCVRQAKALGVKVISRVFVGGEDLDD